MPDLTLKIPGEHVDDLISTMLPGFGPPGALREGAAMPPPAPAKPQPATGGGVLGVIGGRPDAMEPPAVGGGALGALPPIGSMSEPARPRANPSLLQPGSSDYARELAAKHQEDASRPWGAPGSTHPGVGGKIGHVLGQIGGYALGALAPGVAETIPQTPLGRITQGNEDEARIAKTSEDESLQGFRRAQTATEQQRTGIEQQNADTEREKADTEKNAPGKTSTPDEQTLHDLMTGDNGQPRVDPHTQQPYSYLDAYQAVKQAGEKPPEQKYEARTIQDPANPSRPLDVLFDPVKGTYLDATTRQPIANARSYQKPTDTTDKDAARSDRSYQFNSTQLEKERAPIEAQMGKIGAALTNINLKSPEADALLAPQILSLSAGGQGSGLRMNQAELARITGGRTQWESLQAAINKWSTDPKHPQIPSAQRQQMLDIVNAAQAKGAAKQRIIEQAEEQLVNADDPKEHRKVVQQMRQSLDAVDNGGGGPTGGSSGGNVIHYDAQGNRVR